MNPYPDIDDCAHQLDGATFITPVETNLYRGNTSAAYGNMVGPFGGVIAAILLKAVLIHPERLGEPVALTVNFAGPITDGEFIVTTKVLRTNRTTQHWYVELAQGDQVGATATAVFATRRDTWSSTEVRFPVARPAATIERFPPIDRAKWTAAYDMRFLHGQPVSAKEDTDDRNSVSCLWIRDVPLRPLDFVSLAAICDAFFPRIFIRRPKWVPIGTVSLTTYFHADSGTLQMQGDRPVLATARALHFGGGYFDQTAEVWSDDETLLATSHQVVYYKE
jgi:acyl-coenzyme A thioesterase PaaI-like protein